MLRYEKKTDSTLLRLILRHRWPALPRRSLLCVSFPSHHHQPQIHVLMNPPCPFIRQIKRFLYSNTFVSRFITRSSQLVDSFFKAKWEKVHGDDLSDSVVQGWRTLTSSGHKGIYINWHIHIQNPWLLWALSGFLASLIDNRDNGTFYLTWQERLNPLNVILQY